MLLERIDPEILKAFLAIAGSLIVVADGGRAVGRPWGPKKNLAAPSAGRQAPKKKWPRRRSAVRGLGRPCGPTAAVLRLLIKTRKYDSPIGG